MDLWRISNFLDLRGEGGLRTSARWHTRGHRVVYLADHPASALLEMRVHLDAKLIPASFQLLRVHVPDTLVIQEIGNLPSGWQNDPSITQLVGDRWIEDRSSLLLRVPSAIVPETSNYLLNPDHPGANSVGVTEIIHAPFDPRLF